MLRWENEMTRLQNELAKQTNFNQSLSMDNNKRGRFEDANLIHAMR